MKGKQKKSNTELNNNVESFAIDSVAISMSFMLFDKNGKFVEKSQIQPMMVDAAKFSKEESSYFGLIADEIAKKYGIKQVEITCKPKEE